MVFWLGLVYPRRELGVTFRFQVMTNRSTWRCLQYFRCVQHYKYRLIFRFKLQIPCCWRSCLDFLYFLRWLCVRDRGSIRCTSSHWSCGRGWVLQRPAGRAGNERGHGSSPGKCYTTYTLQSFANGRWSERTPVGIRGGPDPDFHLSTVHLTTF